MEKKKALILGATGLVGNELLKILLNSSEYGMVIAIVRRPLTINHPKLREIVSDFENLEAEKDYFAVDDVFCCLGTTIKKAKTQEKMYKIDVEYPLEIARLAELCGAKHFLLVSSMNANPNSRIFYSRIKGQLEELLQRIPYERISILRPSLLLGNRKEHRFGEELATKLYKAINIIFRKPMPKLAIEASVVAEAMHRIAQTQKKERVAVYSASAVMAYAIR
ncbi:oxidoreductase [Desulfuribacillus alkaliarsenatis]|uniref:Oxidoreductase n=1 Tax=Desulfuribacillus alkaliarsenatis TaxID=766136 RepID=A0A1E5G333_9FIRM|nr:oxidoreductase [Desulfuribacillus alkaliarsenatis]OEF97380.1 oxidoreductase [Desulfuribacillus alkaliarsenatis]